MTLDYEKADLDHWQAGLTLIENNLLPNISVLSHRETGKIIFVKNTSHDGDSSFDDLFKSANQHNLSDKILLPGFVNAHSHAFQRGLRGKGEEGDGNFWTWREGMMKLVASLDEPGFYQLVLLKC